MPSYRRFVTYLFQYENKVKTRNCGFAKIEMRQGRCRMEIQVRGLPEGAEEVYLFTGSRNEIYGVRIGSLEVRNGAGTGNFVLEADHVGDSDWRMEEMKGIYLKEENGNFAASQWEDEELDWENFRIYQRTEKSPGGGKDAVSACSEIHATQAAAAQNPVLQKNNAFSSYKNTWEKQWQQFSAAHPVFCPFDEAQNIFAVKMDLRDFKILPKQYLTLVNNSFLLHGYFNYKFLLFGYMDGEERKWFLGVPGIFQNQEQLLAGLFGFGEFRTKHVTKQKTGEFGYWYRYLEL